MNNLVKEANELLRNGTFDYAICGGYAIELFLKKQTRTHGDIDISVYWEDRDKIILYMKALGWNVYEMCGNGIAHCIDDINEQIKAKRNIFCFKDDCNLVKLYPQNEKNMYHLEFDHRGQFTFDFIEFLFNNRSGGDFLYARNIDLKRELGKSILEFNGIPFLSPELVLLYKSTDINREGYQLDYDEAIVAMNDEQKSWLKNALALIYPSGHPWNNNI